MTLKAILIGIINLISIIQIDLGIVGIIENSGYCAGLKGCLGS